MTQYQGYKAHLYLSKSCQNTPSKKLRSAPTDTLSNHATEQGSIDFSIPLSNGDRELDYSFVEHSEDPMKRAGKMDIEFVAITALNKMNNK